MCDQADGPTLVRSINYRGDITGGKGSAGIPNNSPRRSLVYARAVFLYERNQGMRLLRAWVRQEGVQLIRLITNEIAASA